MCAHVSIVVTPVCRENRETDTTTRINKKIAVFDHPFCLDEIEEQMPAGRYTIETEEESLSNLSYIAFRRIATVLIARPPPSSFKPVRFWTIDPDGLALALKRDAAQTELLAISGNQTSEPPHE